MGEVSKIHVFDLLNPSQNPLRVITIEGSKVTRAKWGNLNKQILTGHEDGTIAVYDYATGKRTKTVKNHAGSIQDIQFSSDFSHFITASIDTTSLIYDTKSLKVLKTFKTSRPVNSATMSPLKQHIVLGGGQEAMKVTTTSQRHEKFEAKFFHKIFEDEIGAVKGHFGPINTLAFHPNGKSFASGGEDGYVRVHHLDDDYINFEFEEEANFQF
ncbi:Eukaryotic translation initiation factor 3 subunit I [Clydaea vesicula]|uniref:Serine-threonine kinase receptor-associated protein n=1 Tax=Clydaea vesicula TaxID=447962 RepID=A0AAD5TT52_9FUNG|nr:Eukaryotic translation initiation factor 3 subunit I [Clydaea vesicula]